jgi:hypothetical protein
LWLRLDDAGLITEMRAYHDPFDITTTRKRPTDDNPTTTGAPL